MKRKQIKELDELWADKVKKRADYKCEKCGKLEGLHAHHIYSRRHFPIRWHTENGICLCRGCHFYWAHAKDYPTQADYVSWIKINKKAKYLGLLANNQSKQDYELTKRTLEGL
jgi:hypothetical protein